ncbi:MAG: hypothetical protein RIE59_04525, partial [Imperialibacter sp.]
MMKNLTSTARPLYLGLFCVLFASCDDGKPDRNSQGATSPPSNIPEEMVYIPAGVFTMGGKSEQASPNEYPNHQVEVS